jgi:hypothetical protein
MGLLQQPYLQYQAVNPKKNALNKV